MSSCWWGGPATPVRSGGRTQQDARSRPQVVGPWGQHLCHRGSDDLGTGILEDLLATEVQASEAGELALDFLFVVFGEADSSAGPCVHAGRCREST